MADEVKDAPSSQDEVRRLTTELLKEQCRIYKDVHNKVVLLNSSTTPPSPLAVAVDLFIRKYHDNVKIVDDENLIQKDQSVVDEEMNRTMRMSTLITSVIRPAIHTGKDLIQQLTKLKRNV